MVLLGKKKYAAGLAWGPIEGDKPRIPQAIEKTKAAQNALYVLYGEIEPVVGHCNPEGGIRAGTPVLAPAVCELYPNDTLVAEDLGNGVFVGFWINSSLIMDDIVGGEPEIREWFESLAGDHKFDHIMAPWRDGYRPGEFVSSILSGGYRPPKLGSVTGERRKIQLLLLIVLSFVVAGIFMKIVVNRRELEREMAAAVKKTVRTIIPPAEIVSPVPFVRACFKTVSVIPSEVSGWGAAKLVCTKKRVRVFWVRRTGTALELERALGLPVHLDGKGIVHTDHPYVLPIRTFSVPRDRLPGLSREKKALVSLAEAYGIDYQMSDFSLPGVSSGETFRMNLREIPDDDLARELSKIPGLSIESIEWTGNGWIIKGELNHASIIHDSPASAVRPSFPVRRPG
jgi:hypothetical protein